MARINFLTGSLAIRNNRTGVHEYHHQLISRLGHILDDYIVSCYATKKSMHKQYTDVQSLSYYNNIRYSNRVVRLLSYLLPIELFFGKSDIYICDGLIPHTIYKSKKVAIIHDLMVKIYPKNYSLLKRVYLNYYFCQCKNADKIIVNSECTKIDVMRYLGIESSRIDVAYCGCEVSDLELMDIDEKAISHPYVLYIGDMRPNKNLINALRGYRLAKQSFSNLDFIIAGSKSNEYQKLADYVKRNQLESSVRFLGYVSNDKKERLLDNAFALLFVSLYEGFGIPVVEAGIHSLPVITSNTSSLKEIGEGASILVDPTDPNSICNAILSLRNRSTREQVIRNQLLKYKKFTWDHTAKIIKSVIDSLQ